MEIRLYSLFRYYGICGAVLIYDIKYARIAKDALRLLAAPYPPALNVKHITQSKCKYSTV